MLRVMGAFNLWDAHYHFIRYFTATSPKKDTVLYRSRYAIPTINSSIHIFVCCACMPPSMNSHAFSRLELKCTSLLAELRKLRCRSERLQAP